MSDVGTIEAVRTAAYSFPTDQPEGDGTLAWSSTGMVVAWVTAGGQEGVGWTYVSPAAQAVIDQKLADTVRGGDPLSVPALHDRMVRAVRNDGRPGMVSCAISAVDIALWDLKARLLGLPLADLLGRARDEIPVYGSGGFTTYDDASTTAQLEHWAGELQLPRVKIKIGESWGTAVERDLARVRLARRVVGPAVALFVDANGAYSPAQATRVGTAMAGEDVTWFEEPVSSDDFDGLRRVRQQLTMDVAAGEYGYDPIYFAHLIDQQAVDCIQADVTRCGGYTDWLAVAHLTAAHTMDLSGHCAPALHVPVAAAAPRFRHLEYFHDHVRIEGLYVDGTRSPRGGALPADGDAPGHGLAIKMADAEPHRVG